MKLDPLKFGLAFGIIYAVLFLVYGLAAAFFGVGVEMIEMISDFYVGFGPTVIGALIGAVWGVGIGVVFFGLAAWIYNRLVGCGGSC